jgi:pyridoxine 4-dehydrogenase
MAGMTTTRSGPAGASGVIRLGDMTVRRMGFGAMQLTGPGVLGDPSDRAGVIALLRRAVALGIDFIDTADAYGPDTNERLVAEALHPYPAGLVIATKGGYTRPGPGGWVPDGRPDHLRQAAEASLRRLRVDRIDLYQLHHPDPRVPFEESLGALIDLRAEGKIRHIGLSNVDVPQLGAALDSTEIASVQNRYNLDDRAADDVVAMCETREIAFIPWEPLSSAGLARSGGRLARLARVHGCTPAQVALAWLLARSPQMLVIPGTASPAHLEENVAAAALRLTPAEVEELAGTA